MRIPSFMKEISASYKQSAVHAGRLEEVDYETWDSLTYDSHVKRIHKRAIVYVPYGYDAHQKYNIVYISHGGWSDETTVLGTDSDPHPLKYAFDHSIEDGLMAPFIAVAFTYNNRSNHDSWDYELAIQLTDHFHNELVNDLMPVVESRYSTYAQGTDYDDFMNSRDHRAFAGFSMGSVNTWRTFEYCLDLFHYFMPMSGNLTGDGEAMADIVRNSKWKWNDFFILSASGTKDFARNALVYQIEAMASLKDHTFRYADAEENGNLFYREWNKGTHGPEASDMYTWNNLLWVTKRMEMQK